MNSAFRLLEFALIALKIEVCSLLAFLVIVLLTSLALHIFTFCLRRFLALVAEFQFVLALFDYVRCALLCVVFYARGLRCIHCVRLEIGI